MKKMNRFTLLMKVALMALMVSCFSVSAFPGEAEEKEGTEEAQVTANVNSIDKFGNVYLNVTASEVGSEGLEIGDMAEVTIYDNLEYQMPVVSNFSDVDSGSFLCRLVIKPDTGEDYVVLAINMGDFATGSGIWTKETTEEDPGYTWALNEGFEDPVPVVITLKEKGGYDDELKIHQLVRSENREDYPNLDDAEYANFREITTTGMGSHALYRSSSPVNPELNRNLEADAASKAAGVKTFMNMADSDAEMQSYEGFDESYVSTQQIICLDMVVDFDSDDFREKLAEGITFLTNEEGPFLVHCTEGKERAGFASAVLEAFMGAGADEIVSDYMVSYYNYYGVEPGSDLYTKIADANIRKSLATAFQMETLEGSDLREEAENYLKSTGLTDETLDILREKLGQDYSD